MSYESRPENGSNKRRSSIELKIGKLLRQFGKDLKSDGLAGGLRVFQAEDRPRDVHGFYELLKPHNGRQATLHVQSYPSASSEQIVTVSANVLDDLKLKRMRDSDLVLTLRAHPAIIENLGKVLEFSLPSYDPGLLRSELARDIPILGEPPQEGERYN